MTILTPELASQRLDALGEPRHLRLNGALSLEELRGLLWQSIYERAPSIGRATGMAVSDVRLVLACAFGRTVREGMAQHDKRHTA